MLDMGRLQDLSITDDLLVQVVQKKFIKIVIKGSRYFFARRTFLSKLAQDVSLG